MRGNRKKSPYLPKVYFLKISNAKGKVKPFIYDSQVPTV
jgi:hypothetical protein